MAATTSLSCIRIWNRVTAHLDNTEAHRGLPPSPYLAERREHPPQIRSAPGVLLGPHSLPDGKRRDRRIRQHFSPDIFWPQCRPGQDQRSTWPSSSASRVMIASGPAASNRGTSELLTSTARMPALFAPWMSS